MKHLKKTKESGNSLKILSIMKKIFIAAIAALTALTACQKNEVAAPASEESVLYVTIEETDATKTYMDANNNIRWSEGDQVVAFMKTSLGLRYQIKDEYIDRTSGYFSQVSSDSSTELGAGTEWDHNIVYYPHSATVEAEKSGKNYVLNVVLPSEQTYAAESFGNGSMAMVAVSKNNNITFCNVLGGMKLQLRGTKKIKSIKLVGKNNEKLSGAATVTAYTDETKPTITMASGASNSVTLSCGSGVQLSESKTTEFILSLPPVLFSKGFTVIVTDIDGKTYTVESDKGNTVRRSSILVMPAFKLGSSQTAPVASIKIDALDRTSITFSIKSDSPGEYAWTIVPSTETVENAEALFANSTNDMFGSSNEIQVTYNELEGGNEYNLYYAVRKINPYVYSELYCEPISTVFPYEDMITLEKVTTNAVSYHIEKPEGAKAYRHMIVDYNDFLYFQALVGVTHDSYLSAFGLSDKESKTFDYEWVQMGGWNNYPTYFYSDTKYLIIAGESDSPAIDAQVSADKVKYIEFTTPKAEVCPYEVDVQVSNITSITADITLTPEEGVDRYRLYVMSEADYESFLFEGEEMVRRAVIGGWDDTSTEYRGPQSLSLEGLHPNSNYYICMVVFDKDMRELYIEEVFTTSEPVGPAPEIIITEKETEEPWNSASINLQLKNTVSALAFIHTKYAVDKVLNAPGNEDLTMDVVIITNGIPFSGAELSKATSAGGADITFSNLSPNTEYVYAIMATNSEYISTSYVYNFKTGAEPVIETSLLGKPHTFNVTITDGVNDATRVVYSGNPLQVAPTKIIDMQESRRNLRK